LGIIAFQGFYFSRPLEFDQFVALLDNQQPKNSKPNVKNLSTNCKSAKGVQKLIEPKTASLDSKKMTSSTP